MCFCLQTVKMWKTRLFIDAFMLGSCLHRSLKLTRNLQIRHYDFLLRLHLLLIKSQSFFLSLARSPHANPISFSSFNSSPPPRAEPCRCRSSWHEKKKKSRGWTCWFLQGGGGSRRITSVKQNDN